MQTLSGNEWLHNNHGHEHISRKILTAHYKADD